MSVLVTGAVIALVSSPAPAFASPADNEPPIVAPVDDGTGGANDGPSTIPIKSAQSSDAIRQQPASMLGPTVCDPNSQWYVASSVTKSGAVTNWRKHIRNDYTPETITLTTTSSSTIQANASVSGSLSASAAINKIASASLGLSANFGLQFEVASTQGYSQAVNFSTPGSWILWAGVYKGGGFVTMKRCSSNGQTISTVGSGSGSTFDRGRITGLTNCANSVSDLIALNAKTKC